ncbi:hypothetical protein LOTGIDRAFT_154892 [Lottia gigantea]|uniref:Aftiphilin clathrin-binding box domain-containing protein n=1 Tax=Lottia gigantea TaxID=225164 RepID=V3ZM78_LOTGI|nr:hypothetical protein LOTGIDRAFT_154892 [Lottia gigantea]ESO85397.1 hypothetical protein LOTGIDRAFT_154892 [Lottia gigantea]
MSSFIPMVSASPPPMEDEKTFGWEDDEEFGTFTGANDSGSKETNSETDKNWSNTIPKSPEESPSKDIDFADFKTFNDNIQGSKPNVTDLPLNSNIISNNKMSPSSDINKMSESVESLDLSEKNSTQTTLKRDSDSGMFSSDLSPIPVAKETLASENCDNDYPESIKLNDSSPETPEEMTISEHDNGSKEIPSQADLDLPTLVENDVLVNDNLDNETSIKDGSLVDSDEEFDDYSSNVLQALSSNAAQSSINPPINSDSQLTECDDSVVNSKPSLGPTSQLSCSADEDDFGDFAEFSDKQLPNESKTTTIVESGVTSATTDTGTKSDMAVPLTDLEKEDHVKINSKDRSDPQENDSVKNSDSNSGTAIEIGPIHDSPSKVEESSSDGKNPENDSPLNDLSEDEDANFSDSQNDVNETFPNSSEKMDQTDLKSDTVCEKVPHDSVDRQTEVENVDINKANDTDKHNVLNNKLNTDDDFADFHKANDRVIENCTENQVKSDSDDDFADFSCAKVKSSEENEEGFADFSSAISTPLTNNDEFADFSHAKSEGENQNDDDFADFSSAKSTSENKCVSPSQIDDDDDFADFSSAKSENNSAIKSVTQHFTENNITNNNDDDFADFSSASKSENFANFDSKKENDDWGNFSDDDNDDFGNFNESAVIQEAPKPAASTVSRTPGLEKIATVIETCFTRQLQSDIDGKNCNIIMLDSLLQGSVYTQTTKPLTHQDILKKVLKHIEDYDNTNALMYSWKKSHSNNRLFKTLRIDTQNMLFGLKKQVVPLSVTGLTLLEPIRGQLESSKKGRVLANLVEPTSTDSIPQLQDMPPVEFDWHNSGLTNPLEAKTLDLDFMVLQENENNAKTRVFQSELLDAPRSSVKPMQPLEDILKNMKSTTMSTPFSETPRTENLSKEADDVIKSLPLLSFMKSKVLMFKLNS